MNERSKVLYITHFSKMSGAEFNLFNLIKHLDKNVFQPILICPKEGMLAQEFKKLNIDIRYLSLSQLKKTINPIILIIYFFKIIVKVMGIVKIIKREKIKLVHCNTLRSFIYGGIAAKVCGTPCVFHHQEILSEGIMKRIVSFN